jgi:hypothetical protein
MKPPGPANPIQELMALHAMGRFAEMEARARADTDTQCRNRHFSQGELDATRPLSSAAEPDWRPITLRRRRAGKAKRARPTSQYPTTVPKRS